MSEKELLKALEEDARRECAAILENASKEAEAVVQGVVKELERSRAERFENMKVSIELQRMRMSAGAKLRAKGLALNQRQAAIAKVLRCAHNRFKQIPKDKAYPDILKRLLSEAVDNWRNYMKGEKALIAASKEDASVFKSLKHIADCEIIPDERGRMSPGVIIISKDKRYKVTNTLESRLDKARPELVSIIDRALFGEIPKS